MKLRSILILIAFVVHYHVLSFANDEVDVDTLSVYERIPDLVESSFVKSDTLVDEDSVLPDSVPEDPNDDGYIPERAKIIQYEPINIQVLLDKIDSSHVLVIPPHINDAFLKANPFFIDLKFPGYSADAWNPVSCSVENYYANEHASHLCRLYQYPVTFYNLEDSLRQLREVTLRKIAVNEPHMIPYTVDKLPDVSDLIGFKINTKPIHETVIKTQDHLSRKHQKITFEKYKPDPWTINSNALLQFSQNYRSSNWHQGGSDNISILGVINGKFNYDNKQNIQWDNFAEWRLGVNSVEGDTLRTLNTNDDIIRASSKLGIKAGGKWFYSTSIDFSTHLFNSYNKINSPVIKAKLLTPVRFNMGVGLDYKYKKLFSLMFSPLSYKFIYANDTINVNQKSFGIPQGENILSQFGSSFKAQVSYSPSRSVQIDSKLSFYTNYEKVEIDWEIIGNFKVNRFLSTRISLNPRYDNTVILAEGETARIQFKELLTFGLSYRLL